jgi:hypothetical protein
MRIMILFFDADLDVQLFIFCDGGIYTQKRSFFTICAHILHHVVRQGNCLALG